MWRRRFRELRGCLQNLALGNPCTIRRGDTHLHLCCRRPLPHSPACVCLLTRWLTPLLAWGTSSLLLARIFGYLSVFSHGGSGPRQGHGAWEVLAPAKKGTHVSMFLRDDSDGWLFLCANLSPLGNAVYTLVIHSSISISVYICLSVFLTVHIYLAICVCASLRTGTPPPIHTSPYKNISITIHSTSNHCNVRNT